MASKRQIWVGDVPVGGGAPVVVQSMTKTDTSDVEATLEQIGKMVDAGCELVRVAVPRDKDAVALETIVKRSPVPVIADIHFNHTLALKAIDAGAHCIRLNPGNIGGRDKVAEVAEKATAAGVPMRIGVNSGSLPKHLHPVEVAVLGCAVNGIGEASHADFGITGAKNEGLIFAHGKPLRKVPQDRLVDELFKEIDRSRAVGRVESDAG